MTRTCRSLKYLLIAQIFTLGFVPIRASEPRIKLDENSTVTFRWNGSVPNSVSQKEKYTPTDINALDDKQIFKALLDDAGKRWSSVPGVKLKINFVEEDSKANGEDLIHAIHVTQDSSDGMGGSALPLTGDVVPNSGEGNRLIVDCDIEISGGDYTARILAETVTHEVGHCLGLGHAHTNRQSIMGYSRSGENPELGADDRAAILYLYPNDELVMEQKELIRTCGVTGGKLPHQTRLLWILMIPLGAMLPLICKRRFA